MCSFSLDALSGCPSLVEIFCLIYHSDILNCKLVNRRFRDVIRRNDVILPRKKLHYLNLWLHSGSTYIPPGISFRYVIDDSTNRMVNASVSEDKIVVMRCQMESFRRLLEENGPLTERKIQTAVGIGDYIPSHTSFSRVALQLSLATLPVFLVSGYSCEIDGREKGLRLLLSFVLRRYHINNLEVRINPLELWCDLVTEQFKACRSHCKEVDIHESWSEFGIFKRNIGFEKTTLRCQRALSTLVNIDDIWKGPIVLDFLETEHFVEPAILLIRKWLSGVLRIKLLVLLMQNCRYFLEYFEQHVLMANFDGIRSVDGKEGRQFVLGRPSDDVILFFALGPNIQLHDEVLTEPIKFSY